MAKHYLFLCGAALTIIAPFYGSAQADALALVDKLPVQRRFVRSDSMQKMVLLSVLIPGVRHHLYYATEENFMQERLYPRNSSPYLRLSAARALKEVQQKLALKGLGIIVWDAYRPYRVTKQMWEKIQDERYVAHPGKGSGHNRGTAVDLTLFDLKTGKELDMGTGFDHFSDTAHHNFPGLAAEQKRNRMTLRLAMEEHGFKALDTEWWHYNWQEKIYPVLNLSFSQLARLAN